MVPQWGPMAPQWTPSAGAYEIEETIRNSETKHGSIVLEGRLTARGKIKQKNNDHFLTGQFLDYARPWFSI